MLKTIRVDVNTRQVSIDNYKEEYKMLGGRSLIAQFMIEEVNPACDPLGPENKLIFCTALFAGTGLSGSGRLSIGGKSPLTGGIKEANAGGMAGTFMARHGIKMIVLDNVPDNDEWMVIRIKTDGSVDIESAEYLAGKSTYATMEAIKEKYGNDFAAMVIGDGGENCLRTAGIGVNEFKSNYPCRLAARGGLGAVMGSKRVKAIILEKPAVNAEIEYVDKEAFIEARKGMNLAIAEFAKGFSTSQIGTIGNVAGTGPDGALPTRNFSGKLSTEYAKIGPEQFLGNLQEREGKNHIPCHPGCVVACSNHYNDKNKKHITSGFEYETVGLCGSNLDIYDLDTIARIDRMCDEMGVDTIEIGGALGVAMYEGKIPWGDGEAVLEMLEKVRRGEDGLAKAIGDGAQVTGELLNSTHIPTCKRQTMAAYDPRVTIGTGVTYATSPMGADHTTGMTYGSVPGIEHEMQLNMSQTFQSILSLPDIFCCVFCWGGVMMRVDLLTEMIRAMYGVDGMGMEQLMGMAFKMLMTERAFNKMAGFTDEDDAIPQFMHEEPSEATGNTFDYPSDLLASVFALE